MDTSVALVQAYLQVNGYFTVAEYPVFEASRGDHARTVTDLDILAFRFAGAGHELVRGRRHRVAPAQVFTTDPVLGCPSDRPDMIVGEVKAGPARLNAAMRNPAVLEVALARFGCCSIDYTQTATQELLARGHVITPGGHAIRIVAFGDAPDGNHPGNWKTIPMGHVVAFLQQYLRERWNVLRHAPIKDPTLDVLALIEKSRGASP